MGLALWLPVAGALPACKRDPWKLLPADQNGVRLLPGFRSRILARSRRPVVASSLFRWHSAPDGGATFAEPDGGWVYVSNCEMDRRNGGVSALRFNPAGDVVDAYPILTGTSRNCAGGATPWGTWLSCEEVERGLVYECDPMGVESPRVWPALGCFNHEAVAVDPRDQRLYLTEDQPDGCLYRFTASTGSSGIKGGPDLSGGLLEAMVIDSAGAVGWRAVPDPGATHGTPTRYQLTNAARFRGGEGIAYLDGRVIFATKVDNRIWEYQIDRSGVRLLYDGASPVLSGVDNLATLGHMIVVAEDGGDMQIVLLDGATGMLRPLLQVEGHSRSEITGPAFDPSHRRLYFSSQRGPSGSPEDGVTYEITGDFASIFNAA